MTRFAIPSLALVAALSLAACTSPPPSLSEESSSNGSDGGSTAATPEEVCEVSISYSAFPEQSPAGTEIFKDQELLAALNSVLEATPFCVYEGIDEMDGGVTTVTLQYFVDRELSLDDLIALAEEASSAAGYGIGDPGFDVKQLPDGTYYAVDSIGIGSTLDRWVGSLSHEHFRWNGDTYTRLPASG